MDASCSLLHSTLSEAGVGHDGSTADPSTPPDLQSYDHILSVVLNDLRKSELLVRDVPKPRSFWELDQEVQVKSGAGALNIDPDMVAELTKAFQGSSTMTKVMDAASAYKVPNCIHYCLNLLKWRRRWSNRSEISGPWPLILMARGHPPQSLETIL